MITSKSKLKIMTIVGTRPELIRLSRVIQKLDDSLEHILVHTGQNYDFELNKIFFDELNMQKPNYFLNIDTKTLGSSLGDILKKIEKVLIKEKPNAVLILGDTNSSISAIMAKRMHIPIYHMEAGNRSFDLNVPEETNRKIIDHIADVNLVYTEHSRRHLLSEGIHHRQIYLTGSPMNEVLSYFSKDIEKSEILEKIGTKKSKYFVVSIHREENIEYQNVFNKILHMLNEIVDSYNLPIIFSCHPRTKKMLESNREIDNRIKFYKPFGFFDYLKLQKNALCVISDSGTVSEESSILNFPAVTLRASIERPEALDTGSILLTGHDVDIMLTSINLAIDQKNNKKMIGNIPADYRIDNTSDRVLNIVVGTAKLISQWSGVYSK